MLLLIDNYDSFTYNLYQYLCELGEEVRVVRNDHTTIDEIKQMKPARIVISPGPGNPQGAGISCSVIEQFGPTTPLLGVCLGHQCIGHTFGAVVGQAPQIMHGKTSQVSHNKKGLFEGIPNPFPVIRYHSLAIQPETVPECLEITAQTDDGTIMGIRHRSYPVSGVQFHPESFMTGYGKELLQNFLKTGEQYND